MPKASPDSSSSSRTRRTESGTSSEERNGIKSSPETTAARVTSRRDRNRISAQTSRNKKKAHLEWLERRVRELEEENARLRAERGLPQNEPIPGAAPVTSMDVDTKQGAEDLPSVATLDDAASTPATEQAASEAKPPSV